METIHEGLLQGAGLVVDKGGEFHHRSGITIRGMERNTQRIDVDMVLEHLDSEQVAQVELLQTVAEPLKQEELSQYYL